MLTALLFRSLLFALLWWILSEGRLDGWLLGAVAVIAATWSSLKLLPPNKNPDNPLLRISSIAALLGFFRFIHYFLWHSIRGGLQVAGMALRGRSALQPGLLEITITLPPGGPRLLLVNSLGLMPGTLGVDLSGTTLRLHVLDERLPVVAETLALQAVIARLFGSSS
jgi:multicomponent Na+:H+ antiporter subunit E